MSSQSSLEPAVVAAVAERLGAKPERLGVRALARGVTHTTLIVDVDGKPVAVLRLVPPRADILPRHHPAAEGRLLQLIAGSGVPAPEALIIDERGDRLGRPGILMSYCEGFSTLTWEQLRKRCGGEAVAEHALDTIAVMHGLEVPDGWPDAADGASHALRDLEGARRLAVEACDAAPSALIPGLDALAADPPVPSGPPCIVHGDYRPANFMAHGGHVTGVLDWEMATVGDRACDFGIATMREWGSWWPDRELLDRYAAASGVEISLRSLEWWRALGYAKVTAFLARRVSDGWDGGPKVLPWAEGLEASVGAWRRA